MSTIIDFPQQGVIGVSLRPKRYDIEIYQGDTFEVIVKFKTGLNPTDLTGVTFLSAFKGISPDPDPVTQPTASAATPTNGEVTVLILDTSTLSGPYNWDLQLVNGTKKRTYLGGRVTVTTDITP